MKKTLALLLATPIFFVGCTKSVVTDAPKAGLGNDELHSAQLAKSPELHSASVASEQEFLKTMIAHHQEAVETSRVVVASTRNAQLKSFAQKVIDTQSREITQMQTWLKEWYPTESSPSEYMKMMGEFSQNAGVEQDVQYIQGMIRHHEGAIEMAQAVQKLTIHPEVKILAADIISTQQAEVQELSSWLSAQ